MLSMKSKLVNWFLSQKNHLLNRKVGLYFISVVIVMMLILNAPWKEWLNKLEPNSIQQYALDGNPKFTDFKDIEDVIIKMGGLTGFFSQDITLVKDQIQTLPWVKEVVARKQWPDRLRIAVIDYEPIARWNDTAFLSKNGVVFTLPVDKIPNKKFPHLFGKNEQSQLLLKTWVEISQFLQQQGLNLKKVKLDDRGSWLVILDNGLVLKLGRGPWQEKLTRFMNIYPIISVPEDKKLAYIDLRYKTGAAIAFTDKPLEKRDEKLKGNN